MKHLYILLAVMLALTSVNTAFSNAVKYSFSSDLVASADLSSSTWQGVLEVKREWFRNIHVDYTVRAEITVKRSQFKTWFTIATSNSNSVYVLNIGYHNPPVSTSFLVEVVREYRSNAYYYTVKAYVGNKVITSPEIMRPSLPASITVYLNTTENAMSLTDQNHLFRINYYDTGTSRSLSVDVRKYELLELTGVVEIIDHDRNITQSFEIIGDELEPIPTFNYGEYFVITVGKSYQIYDFDDRSYVEYSNVDVAYDEVFDKVYLIVIYDYVATYVNNIPVLYEIVGEHCSQESGGMYGCEGASDFSKSVEHGFSIVYASLMLLIAVLLLVLIISRIYRIDESLTKVS